MSLLANLNHALSKCLGHLIGDPIHAVSASAIQSVMKAGAALESKGETAAQGEIMLAIEDIISTGRAVTEQEWNNLKALAERYIASMKSAPPVPVSPAAAPASDTTTSGQGA